PRVPALQPLRVLADRLHHELDVGAAEGLADAGDARVRLDLDHGAGQAPQSPEPPGLRLQERDGDGGYLDLGDLHATPPGCRRRCAQRLSISSGSRMPNRPSRRKYITSSMSKARTTCVAPNSGPMNTGPSWKPASSSRSSSPMTSTMMAPPMAPLTVAEPPMI